MMMYGSAGTSFRLPKAGLLKLTPSMSSEPPLELDGVRGRLFRSARFLYELLRIMFSFSACIPRIFGGVVCVGGGVGGISPVTLTSASMPAHSSLRAVTGPIVNTSRLFGDAGGEGSSPGTLTERPVSAEGFGRGGRMYVKESAESWMSGLYSVGDEADTQMPFADLVGDMAKLQSSDQKKNSDVSSEVCRGLEESELFGPATAVEDFWTVSRGAYSRWSDKGIVVRCQTKVCRWEMGGGSLGIMWS